MRRLAVLVTALVLGLPAAPALAQNPFGPPVAPSQPTPVPTPAPTANTGLVSDTGTTTLYIIAAGLLVAFLFIGLWISRDARRSTPEHRRGRHAMAEPAHGVPAERRRDPKAKARARKKARAQRHARKHNRP